MDFLTLLLILAAGAAVFWVWRKNRSQAGQADTIDDPHYRKPSPNDDGSPRIENLGPGGVFAVRGVGDDMRDFDVRVLSRHLYDEEGYTWFEVEGETGDGKVWLTIIEDDELELYLSLRQPSLAELGLTRKKLKKIDNDEEGTFEFEGMTYVYEDSNEATFYRDGSRTHAEPFYYWDFESRDGTRFITVEQWGEGSYEGHLSQVVKPSQITVYSATG